MSSQDTDERENFLLKKLKENSKKKWSVLWAIFITVAAPFLLPLLPMKNVGNLASGIGYWNAVLFFGAILLIVMPYWIYKEYDKMKKTKFDIERELKYLKK